MTDIKFEIPADYALELEQLSGDHSSRQWKLAEIAVALLDVYSSPQDPMFPASVVRDAIADRAGVGAQSVRLYERVARTFPIGVRHAVDAQDVLTFEHWRAVVELGERGIDYCAKALDTAHEYGGRPAPVRVVQAWVAKHQGKKPHSAWERLMELLATIAADGREKPEHRRLAKKWSEEGK